MPPSTSLARRRRMSAEHFERRGISDRIEGAAGDFGFGVQRGVARGADASVRCLEKFVHCLVAAVTPPFFIVLGVGCEADAPQLASGCACGCAAVSASALRCASATRMCSERSARSASTVHAASDRRQRSRTWSSVASSASACAWAARARKNSRFELRITGPDKLTRPGRSPAAQPGRRWTSRQRPPSAGSPLPSCRGGPARGRR
jgi:hypothetical protein